MNIIFIIIGILLFNVIVLAHEWGHYFTAKSFGVKVNEFALGMGPRIFKVKKGETVFSLRIFPIGGFCAMEGEDEKSEDPRAFDTKKPWQKMIIVSMGAIMNLVVGFLLIFVLLVFSGSPLPSTTIYKFQDNALSESSGLKVGDEIIKVNSHRIISCTDLRFEIPSSKDSKFNIQVKRDGKLLNLENIEFGIQDPNQPQTNQIDFYVSPVEKNIWTLTRQTFLDTISIVKVTWSGVIKLITGNVALKEMSGPVGIVSAMGQTANEGLKISWWAAFSNLLYLIALITINLGVINLLPLPALDGGRLVFILFELITGKRLDSKYEGLIHTLGFILFIILTIFIFYNDIMKLLGKT